MSSAAPHVGAEFCGSFDQGHFLAKSLPQEIKRTTLPIGQRLRCREIASYDVLKVVALLHRGFGRSRSFWENALRRLAEREIPADCPRFGFLMEDGSAVVGVLLTIYSEVPSSAGLVTRCNLSSWYVEPGYRAFAAALFKRLLRDKTVTFLNVTPAPATLPLIEHYGFKQFSNGWFRAIPALNLACPGASSAPLSYCIAPGDGLRECDVTLLRDHAACGCVSLVGKLDGIRFPLVFAPRGTKPLHRYAYLVYAPSTELFIAVAGPVGRFLLRQGIGSVIIDANGPVPGLVGVFRKGNPKYYNGPHPPSLGDLAYTERSLYGI